MLKKNGKFDKQFQKIQKKLLSIDNEIDDKEEEVDQMKVFQAEINTCTSKIRDKLQEIDHIGLGLNDSKKSDQSSLYQFLEDQTKRATTALPMEYYTRNLNHKQINREIIDVDERITYNAKSWKQSLRELGIDKSAKSTSNNNRSEEIEYDSDEITALENKFNDLFHLFSGSNQFEATADLLKRYQKFVERSVLKLKNSIRDSQSDLRAFINELNLNIHGKEKELAQLREHYDSIEAELKDQQQNAQIILDVIEARYRPTINQLNDFIMRQDQTINESKQNLINTQSYKMKVQIMFEEISKKRLLCDPFIRRRAFNLVKGLIKSLDEEELKLQEERENLIKENYNQYCINVKESKKSEKEILQLMQKDEQLNKDLIKENNRIQKEKVEFKDKFSSLKLKEDLTSSKVVKNEEIVAEYAREERRKMYLDNRRKTVKPSDKENEVVIDPHNLTNDQFIQLWEKKYSMKRSASIITPVSSTSQQKESNESTDQNQNILPGTSQANSDQIANSGDIKDPETESVLEINKNDQKRNSMIKITSLIAGKTGGLNIISNASRANSVAIDKKEKQQFIPGVISDLKIDSKKNAQVKIQEKSDSSENKADSDTESTENTSSSSSSESDIEVEGKKILGQNNLESDSNLKVSSFRPIKSAMAVAYFLKFCQDYLKSRKVQRKPSLASEISTSIDNLSSENNGNRKKSAIMEIKSFSAKAPTTRRTSLVQRKPSLKSSTRRKSAFDNINMNSMKMNLFECIPVLLSVISLLQLNQCFESNTQYIELKDEILMMEKSLNFNELEEEDMAGKFRVYHICKTLLLLIYQEFPKTIIVQNSKVLFATISKIILALIGVLLESIFMEYEPTYDCLILSSMTKAALNKADDEGIYIEKKKEILPLNPGSVEKLNRELMDIIMGFSKSSILESHIKKKSEKRPTIIPIANMSRVKLTKVNSMVSSSNKFPFSDEVFKEEDSSEIELEKDSPILHPDDLIEKFLDTISNHFHEFELSCTSNHRKHKIKNAVLRIRQTMDMDKQELFKDRNQDQIDKTPNPAYEIYHYTSLNYILYLLYIIFSAKKVTEKEFQEQLSILKQDGLLLGESQSTVQIEKPIIDLNHIEDFLTKLSFPQIIPSMMIIHLFKNTLREELSKRYLLLKVATDQVNDLQFLNVSLPLTTEVEISRINKLNSSKSIENSLTSKPSSNDIKESNISSQESNQTINSSQIIKKQEDLKSPDRESSRQTVVLKGRKLSQINKDQNTAINHPHREERKMSSINTNLIKFDDNNEDNESSNRNAGEYLEVVKIGVGRQENFTNMESSSQISSEHNFPEINPNFKPMVPKNEQNSRLSINKQIRSNSMRLSSFGSNPSQSTGVNPNKQQISSMRNIHENWLEEQEVYLKHIGQQIRSMIYVSPPSALSSQNIKSFKNEQSSSVDILSDSNPLKQISRDDSKTNVNSKPEFVPIPDNLVYRVLVYLEKIQNIISGHFQDGEQRIALLQPEYDALLIDIQLNQRKLLNIVQTMTEPIKRKLFSLQSHYSMLLTQNLNVMQEIKRSKEYNEQLKYDIHDYQRSLQLIVLEKQGKSAKKHNKITLVQHSANVQQTILEFATKENLDKLKALKDQLDQLQEIYIRKKSEFDLLHVHGQGLQQARESLFKGMKDRKLSTHLGRARDGLGSTFSLMTDTLSTEYGYDEDDEDMRERFGPISESNKPDEELTSHRMLDLQSVPFPSEFTILPTERKNSISNILNPYLEKERLNDILNVYEKELEEKAKKNQNDNHNKDHLISNKMIPFKHYMVLTKRLEILHQKNQLELFKKLERERQEKATAQNASKYLQNTKSPVRQKIFGFTRRIESGLSNITELIQSNNTELLNPVAPPHDPLTSCDLNRHDIDKSSHIFDRNFLLYLGGDYFDSLRTYCPSLYSDMTLELLQIHGKSHHNSWKVLGKTIQLGIAQGFEENRRVYLSSLERKSPYHYSDVIEAENRDFFTPLNLRKLLNIQQQIFEDKQKELEVILSEESKMSDQDTLPDDISHMKEEKKKKPDIIFDDELISNDSRPTTKEKRPTSSNLQKGQFNLFSLRDSFPRNLLPLPGQDPIVLAVNDSLGSNINITDQKESKEIEASQSDEIHKLELFEKELKEDLNQMIDFIRSNQTMNITKLDQIVKEKNFFRVSSKDQTKETKDIKKKKKKRTHDQIISHYRKLKNKNYEEFSKFALPYLANTKDPITDLRELDIFYTSAEESFHHHKFNFDINDQDKKDGFTKIGQVKKGSDKPKNLNEVQMASLLTQQFQDSHKEMLSPIPSMRIHQPFIPKPSSFPAPRRSFNRINSDK